MTVIDKKGKVLGLINAVDLFILLVILACLIGFFWARTGHTSINKVVKAEGPAEVVVAIRGARVQDLKTIEKYKRAFIIIRNQPYTTVDIVDIKAWRRPTIFYNANQDKVVKMENIDDPYVTDADITIRDNAQFTGEDIVFGGNKIKAGIPIELETMEYKFSGSVIAVSMAGVTK
jgi:hypothetical protein